ncbi:hypothetical protein [Granulicella sp. dw_53]|uniref:hypothetical protein n=1 Tax=Granulicella sp. dw_53 TaxID=2719792 RepID=UPI001BD5F66B|nr:hypothetical protein [Granulicella sp. dw_53]
MSRQRVQVRELAAWDLDDYSYRPLTFESKKLSERQHLPGRRSSFRQSEVMLQKESAELRDLFSPQARRSDLLVEMTGLDWSLGVVDLRQLLAFQRRLFFNSTFVQAPAPAARDWPALLAFSFGPSKPVECDMAHDADTKTFVLRSSNPNLHFRTTNDAAAPLEVHAGGPFFEVACYRGRWFLRDGYHRAYNLLKAGVFEIPAVIVQARTIEELGATQPWFFSEEVLFSEAPPYVSDFLDDELIFEYDRPPLIKTLRVTLEEILAPASMTGEQL